MFRSAGSASAHSFGRYTFFSTLRFGGAFTVLLNRALFFPVTTLRPFFIPDPVDSSSSSSLSARSRPSNAAGEFVHGPYLASTAGSIAPSSFSRHRRCSSTARTSVICGCGNTVGRFDSGGDFLGCRTNPFPGGKAVSSSMPISMSVGSDEPCAIACRVSACFHVSVLPANAEAYGCPANSIGRRDIGAFRDSTAACKHDGQVNSWHRHAAWSSSSSMFPPCNGARSCVHTPSRGSLDWAGGCAPNPPMPIAAAVLALDAPSPRCSGTTRPAILFSNSSYRFASMSAMNSLSNAGPPCTICRRIILGDAPARMRDIRNVGIVRVKTWWNASVLVVERHPTSPLTNTPRPSSQTLASRALPCR